MTTRSLSPEQIEALKAQFDVIDQNGDGFITVDELETLLRREAYSHLGEAERRQILLSYARADANGDGGVDFDEFLTLVTQNQQEDARSVFRQTFDAFDLDGDGFLTAAEFKAIGEQQGQVLTPEQAEAMIQAADRNQDGKVSFDEFYAIMTAKTSP